MEHLISNLQDKNKINELTIKVSLLEEENPNYRKPNNHWQNAEYFKYREGQSG